MQGSRKDGKGIKLIGVPNIPSGANKALYDQVAAAAERAGYSSTEEFVTHILEREVATQGEADTDEEVKKQLRDLGYIVEKQLRGVADTTPLCAVSTQRPGTSIWDRLLYPGERAFDSDSPVEAIVLDYPPRSTPAWGSIFPGGRRS